MFNRRDFSKGLVVAGGSALLTKGMSAATPGLQEEQKEKGSAKKYDLLIKGGTVIDPSQQLHTQLDIGVKDGKIVEVAAGLVEGQASQVYIAKDRLVTPGFIDSHVHCYDGVYHCINADLTCLAKGVTTVLDAGTSGAQNVANFHKYIVNASVIRTRILLNINQLGIPGDSIGNRQWVDPMLAGKTALNHKPAVVGIKVRLGNEIQGADDVEYLKRGIQAAEIAGIPMYAHVDGTNSPLENLLPLFRKGDVYAHYLNGHPHGILDANGKILPVVLDARSRGVLFDAAEGGAHLNFEVAQKCMDQNFLPDQLSTDLSLTTAPTHDLPVLVSKFLALGVDLEKAIQMVTLNPAKNFNFGETLGTLQPGKEADISIFELQKGSFEFTDGYKQKRSGTQRLINTAVVRHGQLLVNRN